MIKFNISLMRLTLIGSRYISNEKVDTKIQSLSDIEIISKMNKALSLIEKSSSDKDKMNLMGFLGAASYELIQRKSDIIVKNPGIPWKELCYLHRVLINNNVRPFKYLPGKFFSEGIYYDEKLYKSSINKILKEDLPQLKESLSNIEKHSFYVQIIPISNNLKRIFEFFYDETHLQFLKHAASDLARVIRPIAPPIALSDFLSIINIGEAFNSLSGRILNQFNAEIVKSFRKARNILSHPEREENFKLIIQIIRGKKSIADLLNINENRLTNYFTSISARAIQIQKEAYGYMYNTNFKALKAQMHPSSSDEEKEYYSMNEQSEEIRRIFLAAENISKTNKDNDDTIALAFSKKNVKKILETDFYTSEFNKRFLREDNLTLFEKISYLKLNRKSYLEIRAKDNQTIKEKSFLEKFNKIHSDVTRQLVSTNKEMDAQLFYLYSFYKEYEEYCKIDKPGVFQKDFILEYEKVRKSTLNPCMKANNLEQEITNLQSYIGFFTSFTENKIGYLYVNFRGPEKVRNAERGLTEFEKDFNRAKELLVKKQADLEKLPKNDNKKVWEIDEKEQKTIASQARNALKQLSSISAFHSLALKFEKNYKDLINKANPSLGIPTQLSFLIDAVQACKEYLQIVSGSLARSMLENRIVKWIDNSKFKDFFKENFQAPRGKASHNQVPMIGDEEYIEEVKVRQSSKDGINLMTKGMSMGLEIDEDGDWSLKTILRDHHPASTIEEDFVKQRDFIQYVNEELSLYTKVDKSCHLYIYINRENIYPSITLYVTDKELPEEEITDEKLEKAAFISKKPEISEDARPWDKIRNKEVTHIFKDKDFIKKTIVEACKEINEVTDQRINKFSICMILTRDSYYKENIENIAATKIQAIIRGHQAKKSFKEKIEAEKNNRLLSL